MKIYDEVVCSQFATDFSGCQKLKRLSWTVFGSDDQFMDTKRFERRPD